MQKLKLLKHAPGAPGLRLFGLGPNFLPSHGIEQLRELLNNHAFWARKRNHKSLKKLLHRSSVVITLWQKKRLVGFGRATSDQIYRAVLWDIVVDKKYQYLGIGKRIVDSILENSLVSKTEKIYLMTTHCDDFYLKMGFNIEKKQKLMIIN